MARRHIHFATGTPSDGGVISGMRGSAGVHVYLDVPAALAAGLPLYRSSVRDAVCAAAAAATDAPPPS